MSSRITRMQNHLVLSISSLFVLLASSTLKAQDWCGKITEFGIFDKSRSVDNLSVFRSTIETLKTYNVQTYEEAKDLSIQFGVTLPIQNLPAPLNSNGRFDDSRYGKGSFASQLEKVFSDVQATNHYVESEFSTANSEIISAWRDCVSTFSTQRGLKAWVTVDKDVPGSVVLHLQYLPLTSNSPNSVTISSVVIAGNYVLDTDSLKARMLGQEVGPNANEWIVNRNLSGSGRIEIKSNDPNYNCTASFKSLPSLSDRPIVQPERHSARVDQPQPTTETAESQPHHHHWINFDAVPSNDNTIERGSNAWVFIVPKSGKYRVNTEVIIEGVRDGSDEPAKQGSFILSLFRRVDSATADVQIILDDKERKSGYSMPVHLISSKNFELSKGDRISLKAYISANGGKSIAKGSFVEFIRIDE